LGSAVEGHWLAAEGPFLSFWHKWI